MITLTQVPNLQETLILQPVRHNLAFAQQRLQDHQIPFHLSTRSYPRLVCAALQIYQRLNLLGIPPIAPNISYLNLIQQLLEYSSGWWMLCQVSETGYLVSSDRHIQSLLTPLNTFAAQILEA
ncbi:MAG: hypothetical protein MUF49_11030 [Oculatellaceae cyanobacterium Prado106]|jgi:hypothetical protein|nr:hypothetical protein [Oculatellaceae cyanobacterium Prado106]